MRARAAALLLVFRLLGVAPGIRLAEEGPFGVSPPGAGAPRHTDRSRRAKRLRWWKAPTLLPLLAGSSPSAGASAGDFGDGRPFWRPRWISKARARAASTGIDVSQPLAFAVARPSPAPLRREDASSTGDSRLGRVLPMALALRGGSDVSLDDQEREFPDLAAGSPFKADPADGEDGDELIPEAFQAFLLKGAWKATIRPHQTLRIQFDQRDDGLYAELRYSDPPEVEFEFIKVLPVSLAGYFLGFSGGSGQLFYQFTHVGEDLRIDMRYPSSFWDGRDHLTLFGHPVSRREPAALPPPAQKPMQDKVIRNIERLRDKDEANPPYSDTVMSLHEITHLMQKPGHWIGSAPLTGSTQLFDLEFKFFPQFNSFDVLFTFEYEDSTVADVAEVHPWDTGDFATEAERSPGYVFTAAGEQLLVEITYVEENFMRRVQTHLEYELLPGSWPVSALYANHADAEGA